MSELARQLPPLATLVVFEAAIRLKSFSRAADECALSQASVSRQMSQLEDNLKQRLFDRRRYDVLPTDAGQRLYTTVRVALLDLAAAAIEMRESAQGRNSFTFYADLSISTSILAPLIGRLQAQFSAIKFNIISSYEPIEHTRVPFDLGFQVGVKSDDVYDVKTIADDLVFPVCSPQFAASLTSALTLTELSHLPLLHLEYENNNGIEWSQFFEQHKFTIELAPNRLVFSSYQISLDVAERGEGVALGWARSVNPSINSGRLVRLTDFSVHIPDAISVYQRKNKEPHPLSADILEVVRSSITPIHTKPNCPS